MRTLTGLLLVAGLLGGYVAHAAPPDASGIVTIGETENAPPADARAGFVVDNAGHIIARIKSNAVLHVNTAGGMALTARMIGYDAASGLALLKVTGDATPLKPYVFGHSPTEVQRKVYGIKINQASAQHEVVAGLVSGVLPQGGEALSGYYQHNALVADTSAGGPLFNNCGEVIGVITRGLKSRTLLKRLFGGAPDAIEYAVPMEWLVSKFDALGMQPERAAAPCPSEAAQAASAQQAKEAAQAEAASAQQAKEAEQRAKEAAQAEAASAQQAKEAEQRAKEAAQAKAASAQQAAEAEQRAKEAAQAELDAVKNQLEAAQGASEEEKQRLREEIAARQREVAEASEYTQTTIATAQVREKQYIQWGGGALGLLLVLLVVVMILRRRAVNRERREKTAAQAGLAKRKRDEERIWRVPAVFIEGTDAVDANGQLVALRVPGASIATTGAIIGRSPEDSDFVINHPQVSRKHFRLFIEQDALMIEDLGSTNGTTVDGKPLKAGEAIAPNDINRVECGHLHLVVRVERE